MNPKTAIDTLMQRNWNLSQIARWVGIHKANVMRIHRGTQEPTWTNGNALIELARLVSGEKGKK